MKKKTIIIILFVSLILLFGVAGISVAMNGLDKQTEKNTTEYSATISKGEFLDTRENKHFQIFTKEYVNSFLVSTNISEHIDIDCLKALESDDKIVFRIENEKTNQFNKVAFIDIVSLKVEEKEIFNLDDYNKYMNESAQPTRIAAAVVGVVLLSISTWCIFLLSTKKTKN
ncbi:MAG: hypothetical protein IJX79_00655 [Clostridia bacterium]|nr:hypothetical protein [Clostridia bacterium]